VCSNFKYMYKAGTKSWQKGMKMVFKERRELIKHCSLKKFWNCWKNTYWTIRRLWMTINLWPPYWWTYQRPLIVCLTIYWY
jgi:arginine/lysine/ornithine decarboxylase